MLKGTCTDTHWYRVPSFGITSIIAKYFNVAFSIIYLARIIGESEATQNLYFRYYWINGCWSSLANYLCTRQSSTYDEKWCILLIHYLTDTVECFSAFNFLDQ